METVFIEATDEPTGGWNSGMFMVARFDADEWACRAEVDGKPMLQARGWSPDQLLDLHQDSSR